MFPLYIVFELGNKVLTCIDKYFFNWTIRKNIQSNLCEQLPTLGYKICGRPWQVVVVHKVAFYVIKIETVTPKCR